jgi:hypothetical protein
VLFFIDESWQTVGTHHVGALGAVAIPASRYNHFCRVFFRFKRDLLGAAELRDSEIRGQHAFAKSAFKRQELHGDSHWLATVDKLFQSLAEHQAKVFVIWTTNPEHSSLRSSTTTTLSKPYRQLLFDLRAYMRIKAPTRLGSLNFDQRGLAEDSAAGSAIANFLVRTNAEWDKHFVQIPNFSVSAVSPGLQAADVIAHLGAHLADGSIRPELALYHARLRGLRYEYPRGPRTVRCTRQIV